MTDGRRKEAIEKLSQEISEHQKKLEQLLMIESDVKLENGNYVPKDVNKYINKKKVDEDLQNLVTIISDLVTIRIALRRRRDVVNIRGTLDRRDTILNETIKSVEACRLKICVDENGKAWLSEKN